MVIGVSTSPEGQTSSIEILTNFRSANSFVAIRDVSLIITGPKKHLTGNLNRLAVVSSVVEASGREKTNLET